MYTSTHTTAGLIIHTAAYAVTKDAWITVAIAGPLSFISHHYLDKLGEYSLGTKALNRELLSFSLLLAIVLLTEFWWLAASSFFFSNLMDFIDKKFGLVTFGRYLSDVAYKRNWKKLRVWILRNMDTPRIFKCHRMDPLKQLTWQQTEDAHELSFAITCFIIIFMLMDKGLFYINTLPTS